MEILRIEDLTFNYPEASVPALRNVSLTINEGDFCVLCGASGCGKSTLLRLIKPELAPHGHRTGEIICTCKDSLSIGFVMQSPDNQFVTDKVWHELAFGLENLGLDTATIRKRVAETASYFGISDLFHSSVSELSGGQKQLVCLACVMTLQPKLLILDEPTSQLDPIAALDFLAVLRRINLELGTTVIMSEHRLEDVLPIANKVLFMENNSIIFSGTPKELGEHLHSDKNPMYLAMPAAMKMYNSIPKDLRPEGYKCPVSVNEGRSFLSQTVLPANAPSTGSPAEYTPFYPPAVNLKEVRFRYEKDSPDILRDLDFKAYPSELYCLLGSNGAGKSTLLKVISGIKSVYSGNVEVSGKVCLLPQNPQALFVKKTVREELNYICKDNDLMLSAIELCHLKDLLDSHPFDLSGGEQQRLGLAKLLLLKPDILLLDEPTKGFDAVFKQEFADILTSLQKDGICIIMVSHDVEFCAAHATRCGLFFDGRIIMENTSKAFFEGNSFYTTSSARIAKGFYSNVITSDDLSTAVRVSFGVSDGLEPLFTATPFSYDKTDYKDPALISEQSQKSTATQSRSNDSLAHLHPVRKIAALITGFLSLVIFIYATKTGNLSESVTKDGITDTGYEALKIYALFVILLIATGLLIGRRSSCPVIQTPIDKRKLSRRTRASLGLILFIIPLTLFIGVYYVGLNNYYVISLLILSECLLPFFIVFEGRKPKARELVTISALCAIAVSGRAAFFMLPQFKPVMAIVILAGVSLGGETGFLTGAVSMLVSNILFSQGPWTPWQMFSMGIIGFLAGVLFRKGILRRSRLSLSVFGVICAIIFYGGIMNPVSALIWGSGVLTKEIIISHYITGFPMDLIHATSTGIFLWFISEPMLEKLDRIKTKYGLLE